MKPFSLLLVWLFLSSASLFSQSGTVGAWSGSLELMMDGYAADLEQLSHQVFCLENQDTLSLRYTPAGEGDFVIFGCEIWGQVSLGEPTLLAQISPGEPGNPAKLDLPLGLKIPPHLLPSDGKSVRVMLRVKRILKVDGRTYLGHLDVPNAATDFTFLLTRRCQ